jgi:hypothetical protein
VGLSENLQGASGQLLTEVTPVVLVGPSDERDDDEWNTDNGNPDADGKTEESQTNGEPENQWPPAPRAEVSEFRIRIINISLWSVLRQKDSAL